MGKKGDRFMRKRKKQITHGLREMEVTINRKQQRVDNIRRNDIEVAGSNKKANANVKGKKAEERKGQVREMGRTKQTRSR